MLWECTERAYKMMCGISSQLGEHRLRTKYNDIEKANLAYRKQRRHTHKQTRKKLRMVIFFGIHTANVVNLARRESIQLPLTA
ncbi:MAG: hypothetical protein ACI4TD_08755 [Phocaeicola sp.]